MARKIDQTLKIHKLERKCIQNGDNGIFGKNDLSIAILNTFSFQLMYFHVQWYGGGENEIICGHVETSESDDECAKCQGSYKKVKSGYIIQCVINGTMKTVFYE